MSGTAIAANLKRIRVARGFTMAEAADAAGISRMAYHSIEKGIAAPRVGNLQNLANALQVKVVDLVRSIPELRSVRFRALKWKTKKAKAQREEIKNAVALWMRDFSDLESMLTENKRVKFALQMEKLGRGSKAAQNAAQDARKRFRLEEDEVISDICGFVESIGIKLHFIDMGLDDFFGLSVNDEKLGAAIIVNTHSSKSAERKIFTIAHELGHILMHPTSFNDDEKEIEEQETEANVFASYFLMSQKAFNKKLEEVKGLNLVEAILHIKRVFKVSYKTVIIRLIEEGIVDDSIWKGFNVRYKQKNHKFDFKGHKEPEPLADIDCIEDRLSRLVREALEKEFISISRAAEILNINIEEMRELIDGWMAMK
jgi:Zn-dependent peptidase ImmA (M78 family)/DNA-binding XRE family transcriptional regulator